MNRLYYVWTEGHGGATGEAPSGPLRHGPFLAKSAHHARAQYNRGDTGWDGLIMKVTTDENYAPRQTYVR